MKKIVITTERKPFLNGVGQPLGAQVEVSEDEAKTMVNAGMAELVAPAKAPAKKAAGQ